MKNAPTILLVLFYFALFFSFNACQENKPQPKVESAAEMLPSKADRSHEIVYYVQEFLGPGPEPAFVSMAPIWNSISPAGKPYTTQVYISAFNMGPHYSNLLPNEPYIHVNDIPLTDSVLLPLWSEIDSLQSHGIEVLFLLGGAGANYPQDGKQGTDKFGYPFNNNTWGLLWPGIGQEGVEYYKDTEMALVYYNFIFNTLVNYGFDGIGLDFETGDVRAESVDSLVANLSRDYFAATGKTIYLSLTPVATGMITAGAGLGGFNYQLVYDQSQAFLNAYNGQFYNGFGSVTSPSNTAPYPPGYENVINTTWTNSSGGSSSFPPKEVILGAQISELSGSKTSGSYQQYLNTVTTLAGKYPNFGGVFAWVYTTPLPGGATNPAQWSVDVYEAMQAAEE